MAGIVNVIIIIVISIITIIIIIINSSSSSSMSIVKIRLFCQLEKLSSRLSDGFLPDVFVYGCHVERRDRGRSEQGQDSLLNAM